MRSSLRTRRRRVARPVCESLEARALLDADLMSSLLKGSPSAVVQSLSQSTATQSSFLSQLPTTANPSASTVPSNGDTVPRGVAVIPRGFLVSNVANSSGQPGTGSSIVRIDGKGDLTPFLQSSQNLSLTGALGVMRKGFVFAGSLPMTTDSSGQTTVQGPGSILVFDRFGHQIADFKNASLIDGPWGMAVHDEGNHAQIFVSNVLNGTVTRLDVKIEHGTPRIVSATQIATGYATQTEANGQPLGPAGLTYDPHNGNLYVASTADNAIYAIPHAESRTTPVDKGTLIVQNDSHLDGPVGLAMAPNGDLLVTNGDTSTTSSSSSSSNSNSTPTPSTVIEYTTTGTFVDQLSLDTSPGAAFGLAVKTNDYGAVLGTVNDLTNTLDLRTVLFPNKKHHDS